MASFLKEIEACKQIQSQDPRGPLNFNRAHLDGMPYRGPVLPLLREEEYEEYTDVVEDAGCATFDLSNEEHCQRWAKIMDQAVNGWTRVISKHLHWQPQADGSARCFLFAEWTKPHRELATDRLPARLQSMLTPAPQDAV